jgi:hypothetical protein
MAKSAGKNRPAKTGQRTLFDGLSNSVAEEGIRLRAGSGAVGASEPVNSLDAKADVRAIQDLLWKEARWALLSVEAFADEAPFEKYLAEHLPQNSLSTRTRYAQTLVRWFFLDGVRGLAARVWIHYRDQALADEILRYLYLRAEPMAGAAVAQALLPITENAVILDSYLPNFLRASFGEDTPAEMGSETKTQPIPLRFWAVPAVRGRKTPEIVATIQQKGASTWSST